VDTYLEKVITAAITILVGMGISGLVVWIKHVVNQNKIVIGALKAVVHDNHHKTCRYLIKKGSITEDELENLECLHNSYTALGMNGTGQKLYDEAKSKPLYCNK